MRAVCLHAFYLILMPKPGRAGLQWETIPLLPNQGAHQHKRSYSVYLFCFTCYSSPKPSKMLPSLHGKTTMRTMGVLSAEFGRLTPRTSPPIQIQALTKQARRGCRNVRSLFALLSMLTPFHCITPIHHTSHEVPPRPRIPRNVSSRGSISAVTQNAICITQPMQSKKHGQMTRTRSFCREADSHRVTLGGPTYMRLRPAVFPIFPQTSGVRTLAKLMS